MPNRKNLYSAHYEVKALILMYDSGHFKWLLGHFFILAIYPILVPRVI